MEGRKLTKGNAATQNTGWDSVPKKLCQVRVVVDRVEFLRLITLVCPFYSSLLSPEVRAVCISSARTDPWRGRLVRGVPTPTARSMNQFRAGKNQNRRFRRVPGMRYPIGHGALGHFEDLLVTRLAAAAAAHLV